MDAEDTCSRCAPARRSLCSFLVAHAVVACVIVGQAMIFAQAFALVVKRTGVARAEAEEFGAGAVLLAVGAGVLVDDARTGRWDILLHGPARRVQLLYGASCALFADGGACASLLVSTYTAYAEARGWFVFTLALLLASAALFVVARRAR